MEFRRASLLIAESVDAWRIIPRAILVLYSTLVFNMYVWYKSIPTYVQENCDAGVLRILMETGLALSEAKDVACSVADIVGGPTAAQSAFVTTIIGLSTGIFGLYVATGRKWERGIGWGDNNNMFPSPGGGYPPFGPHNPYSPPNNAPYGPQTPYNPRPYGPGASRGPWGSEPAGADTEDDVV